MAARSRSSTPAVPSPTFLEPDLRGAIVVGLAPGGRLAGQGGVMRVDTRGSHGIHDVPWVCFGALG